MVQAPAHSELGASGMHRWRNCPGSVKLSRGVPNVSSRFAEEGTEAHDLAKRILEARGLGRPEPDTFEYEEEMLDMVGVYVDHIVELGQEDGAIQLFEHRFDLSSIFPGCFGTADGVTYYPGQRLLIVTDLKYGAGILVDVKDNPQLKYYALGAMISTGWDVMKVRLEICQPRTWMGEPVTSYELDAFDLWEFADEIREAALRTQLEETQLTMGDWCRFCPSAAAGICPIIKKELVALPTATLRNWDIPPIDYDAIGRYIKMFPILKGIMSQMTEFAYQQAQRGIKIPGTKLVAKRSHRRWKNEQNTIAELIEHGLDKKNIVKMSMLSPAEIEKLPKTEIGGMKKKELKKIVTDLTDKNSSGFALVSEDDDRPEVKKIDAKTVFASAVEFDAFE